MIMNENILLVDARNLIDRYWHATKEKEKTLKMVEAKIEEAMREFSIKYLMIATDIPGAKTIRHDFYEKYKSNRERNVEKEEVVTFIIEYFKSKYFCIYNKKYEADDFIASAVKALKEDNKNIFILSTDKDLFALISDTVFCIDHSQKNAIINREAVFNKLGVYPEQITDYLSLMGDQADSIPGAAGIGKKTASKILKEYKSLKNIYSVIDEVDEKTKKKLVKEKNNIIRSYKLVKLQDLLLLNLSLNQLDITLQHHVVLPKNLFE